MNNENKIRTKPEVQRIVFQNEVNGLLLINLCQWWKTHCGQLLRASGSVVANNFHNLVPTVSVDAQ